MKKTNEIIKRIYFKLQNYLLKSNAVSKNVHSNNTELAKK